MGKITLRRIFWPLLTCLMLSPPPLLSADATITVTQEQSGREIAVKVGDILQIELPGTGGTGYSWSVEEAGAPYLKLLDHTTRQIKESLPGGPVLHLWRFKAEKPGAGEIKMAYYRPWEGVGKAVDHFRLKLRIE